MDSKKLLYLNLAIVTALVSLYAYESNVPPVKIHISQCSAFVGQYVEIQGVAWRVNSRNEHTSFLLTEDFKDNVMVFADFKANIYPGMEVSVSGILTKNGKSFELQVSSKEDIKVIKHELYTSIPVLLANPEKFVGFRVRFTGIINYTKMEYLNLTDSTGFIHAKLNADYVGERSAYFTVFVKNKSFIIKNASLVKCGNVVNISQIKEYTGDDVCVHARIYDYGVYMLISNGKYHIRVYAEVTEIPKGYVEITGTFSYLQNIGEYVVYAKTIK